MNMMLDFISHNIRIVKTEEMMRIGIIPEGMGEKLAMNPSLLPEPFFIAQWGMVMSKAIMTGVKLGIFDLVSTPRTAAEISITRNCDDNAMTHLMDFLAAAGYLKKKNGLYSNTELSRKWLMRDAEYSLADAILLLDEYWKDISSLDSIMRKGAKVKEMNERTAELSIRGNAVFAKYRAKEVCAKIKLKKPAKMLDVGGGHCMYSMEMCSRYPGMKAEIIEMPEIVERAKNIVEENGMSDRVLFRQGDLRSIDWGNSYDTVFLFNVLGSMDKADAQKALKNALTAVKVGGIIAVQELDLAEQAGFSDSVEFMLYYLSTGRTPYSSGVLKNMMIDAGIKSVNVQRIADTASVLITGKR